MDVSSLARKVENGIGAVAEMLIEGILRGIEGFERARKAIDPIVRVHSGRLGRVEHCTIDGERRTIVEFLDGTELHLSGRLYVPHTYGTEVTVMVLRSGRLRTSATERAVSEGPPPEP